METKKSMVLEFEIKKQTIERKDSFRPVAYSKKYLYAHFSFDNDWDGLEKKAVFNHGLEYFYETIDENNTCLIPTEVIKPNHFKMMVKGLENGEEKIVTSNPEIIGITDTFLSEGNVSPIRFINSNSLQVEKNGDVLNIEIPNDYGIKISIDNNGILKLLGKDEVVLSEVDLPTEKIIRNVYYNQNDKSIVFEFENSNNVVVPIKDVFNSEDYYTKEETKEEIGKAVKENIEIYIISTLNTEVN